MAKKSNWRQLVGTIAAIVGIVGGGLAIQDYFEKHPRYDLSGRWTIETKVEHTSYAPYQGTQATFTVAFTQIGTQITGVGEKTSVLGQPVSGHEHTRIEIQGKLDGGRIHAMFTEHGVKRDTSGVFDWKVTDNVRLWVGTFSSTAADTSGPCVLTR